MLRNPVAELESVVALDEAVLVTVRPWVISSPAQNRPACSDQTRCSRRKVKGKTGHDAALD
jgi:hypothetical protein